MTPARFAGRVALVTGASSGIGAALAWELAREGAAVILAARRRDRLDALVAAIAAESGRALAVSCDVTRDGELERAVEAAREIFGRLDLAVANAGLVVTGELADLTLADWRRQFEVNVLGVVRTARAALAELSGTRGCLAVIGSASGHIARPGLGAYAASKFAVRGFCDSIRPELEARGVSVVLINPGRVATEIDGGAPRPAPFALTAEAAARRIARAIAARRREATISAPARLALLAHRHVPGAAAVLPRLARRLARARERQD
jgi:short-subunit dehydrogenase